MTLSHLPISTLLALSASYQKHTLSFLRAALAKWALPAWRGGMGRATLGSVEPQHHLRARLCREHFSSLPRSEIPSQYSNKWDRCGNGNFSMGCKIQPWLLGALLGGLKGGGAWGFGDSCWGQLGGNGRDSLSRHAGRLWLPFMLEGEALARAMGWCLIAAWFSVFSRRPAILVPVLLLSISLCSLSKFVTSPVVFEVWWSSLYLP